MKERLIRGVLAGLLALGALSGVACDKEDERDLQEFGRDVEKGAEDVGQDVENTIDDADTDGKDD